MQGSANFARLKDWAKENDCWIEDPKSLGVFSDRGSENEVYMCYDGIHVYKLNDFRYSDDNLTPFFEDNGEYFTNGIHDIFDAVPNNVMVGDDGNYYFIDTIIFKSDTDGLDTYKKFSPNYRKSKE